MSSFEQLHPKASDCEDPSQRPEGTAALKEPLSQNLDSRDSHGGFCPTPQKKDTNKDENTLPPPNKRLCFSQEPSDSDGSAGQEVQKQRPLLESSGDGTVKQEVQDVAVDPVPDAHSGLSRTTSGDDVPEKLPNEILQLIYWKKLYYQYLERTNDALLTLQFFLQWYGLTKEYPQCMLGFIRYVAAVQNFHCQDPTAVLECLQHHSLFPKAEVCIAKSLPDLNDRKEQPAYVRAVMAAIVLLAGGVCDVQELVNCLQRPRSTMMRMDILEMLYCVATLLYTMRENEVRISNRLYYNVFHCLYHLENSPLSDPELSSSERNLGPVLQLTSEQQQILNHAIAPGERVKIVGFAGTGRTSTLIEYASKWSEQKFLYLAFSKTMVDKVFNDALHNLTCKTFHKFALDEIKKNYQNMKDYKLGSLTSYEVGLFLSNPENQPPFMARRVAETLKAFFVSADESITMKHVPIRYSTNLTENEIVVEEAKQMWRNMKTLNPNLNAPKVTHDGYLKVLQLGQPSISDYKVILVDGVEDCTPAIMDIILMQKCGVILAGDSHQQIYTFRGANNEGFHVRGSRDFYLMRSFRFDYEIAYVGATLLDIYKKVRNKTLVGNNQESDVMEGKMARLSRTNKNIVENAMEIINKKSSAKIYFLGGYKSFGFKIIHDLWKLLHPELELEIDDSFIKIWKEAGKDFTSLKEYAKKEEEKDLEGNIEIVEKYQNIPELLERIKRCSVSRLEVADYILGTVHKAKGLEFDTVKIEDDFESYPIDDISEEQYNLLYVAVTRAKNRLIKSTFLKDILNRAEERYIRFEGLL